MNNPGFIAIRIPHDLAWNWQLTRKQNGSPVNLSGRSYTLELKRGRFGGTALTLTAELTSAGTGVFTFYITQVQSAALKEGKYRYRVVETVSGVPTELLAGPASVVWGDDAEGPISTEPTTIDVTPTAITVEPSVTVITGAGGSYEPLGAVATHTGDTSDAHDASAISFVPTGTISSTDVQAAIAEVASEAGGGGGVSDHGALTGLADDDHTQYHNNTRGDARYSQLGHNHTGVYAPSSHTHAEGDVTGLTAALAGKAASSHTHAEADVTGLTAALAGKAATSHSHAEGDVTGLTAALAGKAATSHTHAQSDVTNLVTDLAGKASTSHNHDASYAPITHDHSADEVNVTDAGGYYTATEVEAILQEIGPQLGGGGGGAVDVQVFTADGTWTKPGSGTRVAVYLRGGGGGGGSGRKGSAGRCGGGGGAGGGYAEGDYAIGDLSATESVTVGAGGAGGAAVTTNSTNGNNGSAGGSSIFRNTIAAGGNLGAGGTTTAGAGGVNTSVQAMIAGGAGANGSTVTGASGTTTIGALGAVHSSGGGGGGGASNGGTGGLACYSNATPAAVGTNGNNSNSIKRGGGGGGGGGPTAAGGNGGNYGGGGGGGGTGTDSTNDSGAGGNGAGGLVVVVTY